MITRHATHDHQRPTLGYNVAVHIDRGQPFAERVTLGGLCIGGKDEQERDQYRSDKAHDSDRTTGLRNREPIDHTISYNLQSRRGRGPGTMFGPPPPQCTANVRRFTMRNGLYMSDGRAKRHGDAV